MIFVSVSVQIVLEFLRLFFSPEREDKKEIQKANLAQRPSHT